MNNLNSVLLEGIISGNCCFAGKGALKRCSFVVSSMRYTIQGKKLVGQETRVWVMIRESRLVDVATVQATDGRGVRIVGYLANDPEDNVVYIEAEHVEYRPEWTDKEMQL
jgi:KaiC/GvpD/RAD55 family RecA-like ATPase